MNFRRDVRQHVDQMMLTQPMEWPIKRDSFWYNVIMGIEHERVHFETSSVILRQAPLSVMQPSAALLQCPHGRFHKLPKSTLAQSTPQNKLIQIEEGATRVGRSPVHVTVPAFSASEYLCSNHEFFAFVDAGGYQTQKYWTEEGWSWVSDTKPTSPRFWRRNGSAYFLRTLFKEVAMPWDWPVECNHHEAAAFCSFLSERTGRNLRLPTEEEFHLLRDAEPTDLQVSEHGPAWQAAPGNVNLEHWASPCPVDTFRSPLGICDVLGNVCQHSATPSDAPAEKGWNAQIIGGSFISTGAAATRDNHYGFRRRFHQQAGFRYVESDSGC